MNEPDAVTVGVSAAKKVAVNKHRPAMYGREELLGILGDLGSRWEPVWEELPTNGRFDFLYSEHRWQAFIYEGVLYERVQQHPDTNAMIWTSLDNSDVLDWMIEHPPVECCVAVSDLFHYSRYINDEYSPWRAFEAMAGHAQRNEKYYYQVGGNDATYLGRALEAWGEYADVIDPYIELINEFSKQ